MKRQTMPSAVEAERAILCTLLTYGRREDVDTVREQIPPGAWTLPHHAHLMAEVIALADRGQPCAGADVMMSVTSQRRRDDLDPWALLGGVEYVVEISTGGDIAIREQAIRAVLDVWTRRKAIAAIDTARERLMAFRPGDDPGQPIASLRHDLDQAESAITSEEEFASYEEAVKTAFNDAKSAAGSERTPMTGPRTPWPSLGPHLPRVPVGEVTAIAGRPGTGKSAVARALAEAAAIEDEDGGAVFVWSLEMTPEAIARRSLATMAREEAAGSRSPDLVHGMTGQDIEAGRLDQRGWERVGVAADRLRTLPIWIARKSDFTPDDLIASMRRAVRGAAARGRRVRLMVVDYLQLLSIPVGYGRNESSAIGDAVRKLKVFAKDYRVPIVLLSQMNRQASDRADELPKASQLYKSGEIEAHVAVVWLLHRPWAIDKTWNDPGEASFVLDKVRGGAPGVVPMRWCGPSEAYLDPNETRL